jgi:hypothetical protein
LTFGAGMKGGAVIGGLLGGPPGALIGAILGGIGVSFFNLDTGAADITGGLADKATGAIPEGKKRLEDGTIVDFDVTGDKDGNYKGAENEITEAISVSTNLGTSDLSSTIVPFSRENDFDKKLALDENVDIVTAPVEDDEVSGKPEPKFVPTHKGTVTISTFSSSANFLSKSFSLEKGTIVEDKSEVPKFVLTDIASVISFSAPL